MDLRRDARSFERSSRSHHDDVEFGITMAKVTIRFLPRYKPLTLTICLFRSLQVQNRRLEKGLLFNAFLARNNVGLISATY